MIRCLFVFVLLSIIAGCQTTEDLAASSGANNKVLGASASAIAGDMSSRLAEQIGAPAITVIKMEKDGSDYANALEAALRGWGYTVIADGKVEKDQKPLQLTWSLDIVDGQILAFLTTSQIALGRAYTPTAAGATPTSPLSILRRK